MIAIKSLCCINNILHQWPYIEKLSLSITDSLLSSKYVVTTTLRILILLEEDDPGDMGLVATQ